MPTTEEEVLPPLEVSVAQSLAAKISNIITAAAKTSSGRQASAKSIKLVARRIPSSWLPKYQVIDEYGFVIWDEAMTILDRILIYPQTTRYRKHLAGAPKEVIRAWQFHSQSLRVGELYIVLDRTLSLLEFLTSVARDCGLPVTDYRKPFEKTFKKTFDRHLRERHRLTHAHERQSMISRIIELSGAKWANANDESENQLVNVIATAFPKLIEASDAAGRTAPKTQADIEAMHEWGAQREARQMLDLVGQALLSTLNDPSVRPAETGQTK